MCAETTLWTGEIALSSLAGWSGPSPRPDAAHIMAVGVGDPGLPVAWAVLRQRRTAEAMHVIGWSGEGGPAAALAGAVRDLAARRGVLVVRALPDQRAAIEALGLADTGRGYAQRWIGAEIVSAQDTGSYVQSTGFTCGPVALAMAQGPGVTRHAEIEIWREATTMIGLTGPGGCDPYGLALSAKRRGFDVTLHFDAVEPVFLDRANTEDKKDLMRFVQSEFREAATQALTTHAAPLTGQQLGDAVRSGAQVILLIDQCHTHDHHAPHWVLVHGERDGVFLVNDPWAEPEDGETRADVDCLPIRLDRLMQMASYGAPAYHAALILRRLV